MTSILLKTLTLSGILATYLAGASALYGQDKVPMLYKSAAFLGRGHTGISNADNENAIFYNPAGLAQGKGLYKKTVLISPQVEISTNTKDLVREIAVENDSSAATMRQHIGQPQHLALQNLSALVFRRAALGIVQGASTDILASKSPASGGLEQVSASARGGGGLTFSLAQGFYDNSLLFGFTGKYLTLGEAAITANLAEYDQMSEKNPSDMLGYGSGTGADVGMMWLGKGNSHANFGLTIANAGNTKIDPATEEATALHDLKQTVNVGISYVSSTQLSEMQFHLDLWDLTSAYLANYALKSHLGVELNVKKFLGVTAGLNQGYATGGLYFNLYFLRLDVGMYSEEVGLGAGHRPDKRFYFRLMGGF